MLSQLNIFLIIFLSLINIYFQEEILFSFQINRHGARSPYSGIQNGIDVYKEKWSLEGNELTDIGKRQLYLLGVKARKRYVDKYNLLKKEYNPQEILIRSTDYNRTIESIYSYLQGLYPSGTGQIISEKVYANKSIIYPPNKKYYAEFDKAINDHGMFSGRFALPNQISVEPIHIFYKPLHEFELYDPKICTTLQQDYLNLNAREEIKQYANDIINETGNLLKDLSPEPKNDTYFHDYWNLYKFTDNYVCDAFDARNFTQIKNEFSYVNDDLLNKLNNKSKKFIKDDRLLTYNLTNLTIVGSSYTMHSLLNWMETAINNKKNGIKDNFIKFVIYSSHDSSVGTIEGFMQYAFGVNVEIAEFADCRFFELYLNDNGKYMVRYLKADDTQKLDIEFEKFKEVINSKTWSDQQVNEFCKFTEQNKEDKDNENKDKKSNKDTYRILLIIFGCADGVLIGIILFLCLYKRKD